MSIARRKVWIMKAHIWEPTHRHLKTGRLYQVTGTRINATNAVSGQVMVDYQDERGQKFCREHDEFADGRFEVII
jgi:hypothetical protein